MNKLRRKEICNIINKLNKLLQDLEVDKTENVGDTLEDLIDLTQCILDDEETYRDNVPENLQNGERYQNSEIACDNLEDTIDWLDSIDIEDEKEDVTNAISNAINSLNKAIV